MRPSDSSDTLVTCEGRIVTTDQLEAAVAEIEQWLALRLKNGACTTLLKHQLARHYCRVPEPLGRHKPFLVDVFAVLDQIGATEGVVTRATQTKRAEPFAGPLLKGLWHKHWFQSSFLVANLAKEAETHGEMLLWRSLETDFPRRSWIGLPATEATAGKFAHAMVIDAFAHRVGQHPEMTSRLTGEWIVFAKTSGRSIYLTLATHGEADEEILARCSAALSEFPELATVAPFADKEVE